MHTILISLDKGIRQLARLSFVLAALAMLTLMLIGSADVIGTLLGYSVPAALEMQEVLLAVSIFLGMAHVQSRHEHIAVDVLVTRLPVRMRRILHLTVLLACAAIFGIIAWRAASLALSSWAIRESASALFRFPIYPGKFLVFFGAAVSSLECLRQAGLWFKSPDAGLAAQPQPHL
jgi:TRAP-type transport system small permease protein